MSCWQRLVGDLFQFKLRSKSENKSSVLAISPKGCWEKKKKCIVFKTEELKTQKETYNITTEEGHGN